MGTGKGKTLLIVDLGGRGGARGPARLGCGLVPKDCSGGISTFKLARLYLRDFSGLGSYCRKLIGNRKVVCPHPFSMV